MYAESITAQNGTIVVLNPNKELLGKIQNRIKLNDGFCPCNPKKDADTKCPCKDVRETGICHCSLYKQLI